MSRRLFAITGLMLLLSAGVWAFLTIRSFNRFETVVYKFDGDCQSVSGVAGPEDIQIDFANRKAFISSFDRRAASDQSRGAEPLRGMIHLFDLDNPLDNGSWRDRTDGTPASFQPLGLHFYNDDAVSRLFVVNEAQRSIELYDVTPEGNLVHLEQFSERRLTSPNDVVGTGPRSFYVSNDNSSGRASFAAGLNFLFRRGTGKIMFFNGTSWHEAAGNIQYANGLALNANGNKLYAAETAGGNLVEYARDQQTGYLKLERKIKIDAAVDNINIDEGGMLWFGAHPRPLALVRHQHDPNAKAPSAVFSYDEKSDTLTNVYADDGTGISGSSSAARLGNQLVIGALFEEKFLICNMAQ